MSESQMIHPAQPAPTATGFTPGAAKDTLDSTELRVFPVRNLTPAEGGAPADAGNVEWNIVLLKGEGFGEQRRVSVRRGDNAVVTFGKVKADISFPNRITSLLNQILYFGDKAIFEASITWVRSACKPLCPHGSLRLSSESKPATRHNKPLSTLGLSHMIPCSQPPSTDDSTSIRMPTSLPATCVSHKITKLW
jgi:hypothetical protein